jgi:hypothetical protein
MRDLAALYGVSVKRLNDQVNRNRARFPEDFMFRLNRTEQSNLRPQNATSSWGGQKHLPEPGKSMLGFRANGRDKAGARVMTKRENPSDREGFSGGSGQRPETNNQKKRSR